MSLKPHWSHLHLCLILNFFVPNLLYPLHVFQQNSQLGSTSFLLQCPVLKDLKVSFGNATAMMSQCPSLQSLSLLHMLALQTCLIECALYGLDDVECPLLDVSSMIHPTLSFLTLTECIVSSLTMAHVYHMCMLCHITK